MAILGQLHRNLKRSQLQILASCLCYNDLRRSLRVLAGELSFYRPPRPGAADFFAGRRRA